MAHAHSAPWLGQRSYVPSGALVGVLLVALTAIHAFSIRASLHEVPGDVELYRRVTESLGRGLLPYRDFEFEYPPYSILCFGLPGFLPSLKSFQLGFAAQLLVLDVTIKGFLWSYGARVLPRGYAAAPVLLFSLVTAANTDFYLQRFDLVPAAVVMAAIYLQTIRHAFFGAGLLLAVGIGMKLYPVLLVPPLLILSWRHRGHRGAGGFGLGVLAGLLPLLLLAVWIPWWRFLAFHAGRGIQAESLYASVLWVLQRWGVLKAEWVWSRSWYDVVSDFDATLLPLAQFAFVSFVFYSVGFVCWRAVRAVDIPPGAVARMALVPLAAFVAFNPVLSPQYMIWICGLAAWASYDGHWRKGALALLLATLLTPVFYPTVEYGTGFNGVQCYTLLARNLLLAAGMAALAWDITPTAGQTPVIMHVRP